MSQRPYSLKVSSLSLSSIADRDCHEGLCVAPDETKINTATPRFSDTSGILESITLSYGVFSLEVKKVFCSSECLLVFNLQLYCSFHTVLGQCDQLLIHYLTLSSISPQSWWQ